MRATSAGVLLLLLTMAACGGAGESGDLSTAPPDLAPPLVPSGCPSPPQVKPADVATTRFLAAQDAFYERTVDGDTAHFIFGSGEKIIRFLWVNTEEKGGAEMTSFGVATVPIVEGWIAAAKIPTIVQEADYRQPGQPHLDPYDRILGLVFLDGELLQTKIIREGRSAYYTQFGCAPPPVHEALLYAEAEARANQRGIWAPGHPTDYAAVLDRWIDNGCRPNPFQAPYCK